MPDTVPDALAEARAEAEATPLEAIDVSVPARFEADTIWPFFDRLRREAPVHFCAESQFGPYWSITTWADILAVETNHRVFSSAEGITIGTAAEDFPIRTFISADEPLHSTWRKPVMPAVGPQRLDALEALIRERVGRILDELPVGETFDWVERVSVELTAQMLAALFDVPFEDRHRLPYWSDVASAAPSMGAARMDETERRAILMECHAYFADLWRARATAEPRFDFISLMAHHPDTRDMIEDPWSLLGNLILLIIGGNDTTRNSISGGVLALNRNPDQYAKLRADPALIPNMVAEVIRWQTPIAHMRRTALEDVELGGRTIRAGEKAVMWYVSGNRDDAKFDDPYAFRIDRRNARSHVSFGYGVHRCMGNHVAEMQLRLLWEEILRRFETVEVVGPETRVRSAFIRGIERLPVRLHPR